MIVEWVLACLPWCAQLCVVCVCMCVFLVCFFGVTRGYFARGQLTFLFFWFLGLQAWLVRRIQLRRRPRMPLLPPPQKPHSITYFASVARNWALGPSPGRGGGGGGGWYEKCLRVSFHYLVVICLSEIVVMANFDESKDNNRKWYFIPKCNYFENM
jgi:hypothetical protein